MRYLEIVEGAGLGLKTPNSGKNGKQCREFSEADIAWYRM
jgi:hypothetical protein